MYLQSDLSERIGWLIFVWLALYQFLLFHRVFFFFLGYVNFTSDCQSKAVCQLLIVNIICYKVGPSHFFLCEWGIVLFMWWGGILHPKLLGQLYRKRLFRLICDYVILVSMKITQIPNRRMIWCRQTIIVVGAVLVHVYCQGTITSIWGITCG